MKTILKLIIIGVVFSLMPQATLASACISNAMQRCVGYSVFSYDSCGRKENWVKDCSYKCQNGQCIKKIIIEPIEPIKPIEPIAPIDCETQIVSPISGIDVSIFCGIKDNFIDLSKDVAIVADQSINCLMVVKNTSSDSIDDVIVRVDIPEEIIGVSEIKINGTVFNGNITSSINIGSFPPNISKLITFSGKTLSPITQDSTKQITGIAVSGVLSSSDSLAINFQPTIAGAINTTASLESSPFAEFFKRWYIWILMAFVLIFLFFVIFRRLSSNV